MLLRELTPEVEERSLPLQVWRRGGECTHKHTQVLYNGSFIDQETDTLEGEMPAQWGHGRARTLTQDVFPPLGSLY